jgi:Mg2+ and Co2+ transporter CorA
VEGLMKKKKQDRIDEIREMLSEDLVLQDEIDRVLDEYESLIEERTTEKMRAGVYEDY